MMPYEDIQFQLVDLPPISVSFMESWMPNALQQANAALLVIDLGIPGCVENVAAIQDRLREKHIQLTEAWDNALDPAILLTGSAAQTDEDEEEGVGETLEPSMYIDFKTGELDAHHWMRGACAYGIMPANGLIYLPAHACGCHGNLDFNTLISNVE